MAKRKIKLLLAASLTLMCCMAMLIAGTYALWSDDVTLSNHLAAGTLKVRLLRTDLQQYKLDERGIVCSAGEFTPEQKECDFSVATKENVFGLDKNGELIAPSAWYQSTLRVANNGGDVAFDYNVYLTLKTDDVRSDADKTLAQQMLITVYNKAGQKVRETRLSDCAVGNGYLIWNGQVLVNDAVEDEDEFTVRVTFTESAANNGAKNGKASFDLLVAALQATQEADR